MIFGWDEAKHARNIQERGYGFDYASLIFEGPVVEWDGDRRDYGEKRRIAVGQADGRVLTVVYTDRDEVRWIIASWPSSRKERRKWHE